MEMSLDNIENNKDVLMRPDKKLPNILGKINLDDMNLSLRPKKDSLKKNSKAGKALTYQAIPKYTTVPDHKTTLSHLGFYYKKYAFYRSGGPEKYLTEIERLEQLKERGVVKVIVQNEDGKEWVNAIDSEIAFLDKLVEKSIVCWGDTYTMHIKVASKFKKWSEKRQNSLFSRIKVWGPVNNIMPSNKNTNDHSSYTGYSLLQGHYCPACQETPCQCSDPHW